MTAALPHPQVRGKVITCNWLAVEKNIAARAHEASSGNGELLSAVGASSASNGHASISVHVPSMSLGTLLQVEASYWIPLTSLLRFTTEDTKTKGDYKTLETFNIYQPLAKQLTFRKRAPHPSATNFT